MAEKKANGATPKFGDVVGKGLTEDGLSYEDVFAGQVYRVREILVDEADVAYDASVNPDKTFNARLNSRMTLATTIVSPATTVDDIAKWTNRKLLVLLTAYDRLNNLPAADEEGNA